MIAFPKSYQHLIDRVKPERDQNKREAYREKTGGYSASRAN